LHEAIRVITSNILQQENKSLPDFRKFNWFAYGEGWHYTQKV
jgi:uncharacterized protein (DUF885 family)